jgi:hypothetical protein
MLTIGSFLRVIPGEVTNLIEEKGQGDGTRGRM